MYCDRSGCTTAKKLKKKKDTFIREKKVCDYLLPSKSIFQSLLKKCKYRATLLSLNNARCRVKSMKLCFSN